MGEGKGRRGEGSNAERRVSLSVCPPMSLVTSEGTLDRVACAVRRALRLRAASWTVVGAGLGT